MARRIGIKTAASNGDIALWEPLYTLADQVFALEPWLFHPEEDLFGVQNPATGAISYVCVMGGIGTHCALALYRGTNASMVCLRCEPWATRSSTTVARFSPGRTA